MINKTPLASKERQSDNDSCVAKTDVKIPQTLQSIVYQEQDAPIFLIQELHQLSFKYWSTFEPKNEDATGSAYSPFDFTTMKEYNLLAAKLWNELVRCNSNNPILARQAFYLNDINRFCSGTSSSSEPLLKSFADLAKNFQLLIQSSATPLILMYKGQTLPTQFFKNLHPVLSELLFLNWSALFNGKEGDSLLGTKALSVASMKFTIQRVSPRQDDSSPASSIEDTTSLLITGILKAIAMINYDGNSDQCSIYGLWPGLNQVVVSFRPPFETSIQYTPPLLDATMAINENCQNSGLLHAESVSPINGPYGLYFDSILNNKRLQYQILYLD